MNLKLIKQKLLNVKKYLNIPDHFNALKVCEDINDSVKEILQPHWSIQSEDEQYSDPEMWDYEPIYNDLQRPMDILYWIDQWFLDDEGYDDSDIESIEKANDIIDGIITEIRE